MNTRKTALVVAMVVSLILCGNIFAQEGRKGPLTGAITASDDSKIKDAIVGLEAIRLAVTTAKPGADLWQTGPQAYPHLQVLADRWNDPRSEEILKQLTNSGPRRVEGELQMQTLAYAAERYLNLLQANRDYAVIINDADTQATKTQKIREYFNQNPAVVPQNELRKRKGFLVNKLIKTAEETDGADAIDLILQYGGYSIAHLSRYDGAIFAYAKTIGSHKARQISSLVGYVDHIASAQDARTLPLIADWLNEETNDREAESFAMYISRLPGGEKYLQTALTHKCPSAVKFAARVLADKNPTDVADALKSLLERRKAEGANTTELADIQTQLSQVQKRKQGGGVQP